MLIRRKYPHGFIASSVLRSAALFVRFALWFSKKIDGWGINEDKMLMCDGPCQRCAGRAIQENVSSIVYEYPEGTQISLNVVK